MAMNFDPMTGEPINPAPTPEQPQMRFDPMTGQPINPTPVQPQMAFDDRYATAAATKEKEENRTDRRYCCRGCGNCRSRHSFCRNTEWIFPEQIRQSAESDGKYIQ